MLNAPELRSERNSWESKSEQIEILRNSLKHCSMERKSSPMHFSSSISIDSPSPDDVSNRVNFSDNFIGSNFLRPRSLEVSLSSPSFQHMLSFISEVVCFNNLMEFLCSSRIFTFPKILLRPTWKKLLSSIEAICLHRYNEPTRHWKMKLFC